MAIVQRPLAAVIAQPGHRSARATSRAAAPGVTGLPSDDAVLRSVVAGDGGDPDKVKATTIGFEAVKALLAKRVDAATAFWNAEGVALKRRRPGFEEFRVDDYGAPSYPELVLCVTTHHARGAPAARAARRSARSSAATRRRRPSPTAPSARCWSRRARSDRAELAAQLDAVSPAFTAGARAPGELREDVLRKWAAWDLRFGILSKPLDVSQAFDFDQVGPVRNP